MRLTIVFLLLSGLLAAALNAQQPVPQQPNSPLPEMKTLAAGANCGVDKPFFAVARDADTYRQLLALGLKLPAREAGYFERHAIIAAFLGERPTGGYSVSVIRRKNRFALRERKPGRGSVTTQAITTPFQIVEIALPREAALDVDFGLAWQPAMRVYHVTTGEFTASGGFAGTVAEFGVKGRVRTVAYGALRTFVFDLQSAGGKEKLQLNNAATGILTQGDEFNLPYLHANTFVNSPGNLLSAAAKFDLSGRKLEIAFKPLPNNIDDGYEGKGRLTAVSIRR
jgi:hypothetical protein